MASEPRPDPNDDQETSEEREVKLPPLILASKVLCASTFGTFVYSISRIALFGRQPDVHLSPFTVLVALGVPSCFVACGQLAQVIASEPDFEYENHPGLFLDYRWGLRFWPAATMAGVFSFARRFLAERLAMNIGFSAKLDKRWPLEMIGPSPSLSASYVIDFMVPITYSMLTGEKIKIVNKLISSASQWWLDFSVLNLFHFFPTSKYIPWIIVPATCLAYSLYSIDKDIRQGRYGDFTDRPYEHDLIRLNLPYPCYLWFLIKSALHIELAY